MKQEDLDKVFRNIIQQDTSELNEEEQSAKENIWDALDKPRRTAFPVWKIAAAILFLLWMGTTCFLQQKINDQSAQYEQLQTGFSDTENVLQRLSLSLQQMQEKLKTAQQQIPPAPQPATVPAAPIIQYQYVDRVIERRDTIWIEKATLSAPEMQVVHDTIWIEKATLSTPEMQVVHDTVWVEVPVEVPAAIANTKPQKKKPFKIEFIFQDKPPKEEKKYRIPFLFNEQEIAQKTEGHNHGIITITVN